MKYLIIVFAIVFIFSSGCNIKYEKNKACCPSPMCNMDTSNISDGDRISFSNLSIDSTATKVVELVDQYVLSATIFNRCTDNNDAHNTKCIIQLPGETDVLSVKVIKYIHPNMELNTEVPCKQCKGFILCDIGHLARLTTADQNAQNAVDIKVITTSSTKASEQVQFGVFTYNSTPENNLRDNYWSWDKNKFVCQSVKNK